MIGRARFGDVVRRQLDLFEREQAELLVSCATAERAYVSAEKDEAEERYGDYMDLVDIGTELLAYLRDNFASTLAEENVEEYEREFNKAVAKRLRRFALEIEDT